VSERRAARIPTARLLAAAVLACLGALPSRAAAQTGADGSAVCDQGVVTSIELDRRAVFDPESTDIGALAWAYRFLNLFHVRTAPSFIRHELLFREGDCLDPFLLDESARLLDQYGFLAQAQIVHEDDGNGGRRVLVTTRDEWSTKVDLGLTYDAGVNLERFQATEENFLGHGIFAEFTHRERREVRRQSLGLATPRFFGRADASVALGRDRPGSFFDQYVRYPFVGEAGRYAIREGYSRGTRYFSYSTDGAEPFEQVLLPSYRELIEVGGARRFGEPGRSVIVGVTVTRDVVDFPRVPDVALGTDFDELQPWTGPLPPGIARQQRTTSSTRVALQLGTRRFRYVEYQGLDGVHDLQRVSLGFFAGVTAGRGFDVLTPSGVTGLSDTFVRAHASFGLPVGASLLHGGATSEARHDDGRWQDVLVDADLVAYLRTRRLSGHTLFARASVAGGWRTELPYQLSLGGARGFGPSWRIGFPVAG